MVKELELFSLEQRRLRGISSMDINACREGAKKTELFPVVPSSRTRGSGQELNRRSFPQHQEALCQWHRLPRGVVESPLLEMLKSHQDIVMGNQLWWSCWSRGLGQVTSRGPFPPQPFCDLSQSL